MWLVPVAFAVPKVFSDEVVVAAVAPDGHHVLLGTLGSFDDVPHDLRERDLPDGPARRVAVDDAWRRCAPDDACAGVWRAGAWVRPDHPGFGVLETAVWADGAWHEGVFDGGHAEVWRADETLTVDVVAGDLVLARGERTVRFRHAGLERLDIDLRAGLRVWWGTDGVLVAFPGHDAPEGDARDPVVAWVLSDR